MNLTARERLLMSLTSKQVDKWIDEIGTSTFSLGYIDYPPITGNENEPIQLPIHGEIKLDIHDLDELYDMLQQRDQRVIKENK